MSRKEPGRRYPLFPPLSRAGRACLSLTCSGKRIGALVQQEDERSAYGIIIESSGKVIPLVSDKNNSTSAARRATAIALSRQDASFVAVGNDDGSLQVYSVDADGNHCDKWIDDPATPARQAIAAMDFVPPPSNAKRFTSSLVVLAKSGNLVAMDVFANDGTSGSSATQSRCMPSSETTGLLTTLSSLDEPSGSLHIQSCIRVADVVSGSSEQPTGAMLVLDESTEGPLVLLGMSGGTLLVMSRKYDSEGYTWDCVKKLCLPSAILSFALSTHGANCRSKFSMLAVGLEDGEVALLDATQCELVRKDDDRSLCPPYSPFHFLRAHNDDGVPVSRLVFYWSVSSEKGCHQLHLAIVSGSSLRVANMSTFEVFYLYHAGSRIRDIAFFPDGPEKMLVSREDGETECITWSKWQILFGESSFQKLHSSFQPKPTSSPKGYSQGSGSTKQSQFAGLFQHQSVSSVSFSGDSNTFAVACGSEVILCDSSRWLPVHDSTVTGPQERLCLDGFLSADQVLLSRDASFLVATARAANGESEFQLVLYLHSRNNEGDMEWRVQDTLSLSTERSPCISFSPLTDHLLVTESCRLSVYDLDNPTSLEATFIDAPHSFEGSTISSAAFSPDGKTIAVCYASTIVFYDAIQFSEETRLEISGGGPVTSASFSVNSRIVAVATLHGLIYVAKKNDKSDWDIQNTLKCDGTALKALFSPDISSPFLAVIDKRGSTCRVFGTESWQVVQEISCRRKGCRLTSIAFDPSGTILAVGGETESLHSKQSGIVLVVRVGELLSLEWFFPGKRFADPVLLCKKLSSLTAVERAQILFHRSDDGEHAGDRGHFPLERRISKAVDMEQMEDVKASLGSSMIGAESSFDSLMECMKQVLIEFPQAVFAGSPGFGNMFTVILERDNPRLLRLLFYVSLISCRSFPYLVMNEEMRNSTVTNALIASCENFPKVVYDVVTSMVLWPLDHYSTKTEDWRVPKDKPIYQVGNTHTLDQISDDDWTRMKGGLSARPMILPVPDMSTLPFLTALTTDCDVSIFASNELGVALEKLWEEEIKWVFIVDFFLFIVFSLCWTRFVTMTNMSGNEDSSGGETLDLDSSILMIVVFLMDLLLIMKGIRQIGSASEWYRPEQVLKRLAGHAETTEKKFRHAARQVWLNPLKASWHSISWMMGERLEDWWTFCDFMTYWMVNATLLQSIWRTRFTVTFAVVTTFLILLKLLGYLRGFENCGWLLSVLYQNLLDSKGFLTVIFTILVGFSVMFRILVGPYDYADYGKPLSSFTSIFEMGILGFVDRNQFEQTQSPVLTMILLVLLILTVYIVALNGYIALLGGSYARVAQNEDANRRFQKATLVVGYLKLITQKHRNRIMEERRYLFALVPIIDDHGGDEVDYYSSNSQDEKQTAQAE